MFEAFLCLRNLIEILLSFFVDNLLPDFIIVNKSGKAKQYKFKCKFKGGLKSTMREPEK